MAAGNPSSSPVVDPPSDPAAATPSAVARALDALTGLSPAARTALHLWLHDPQYSEYRPAVHRMILAGDTAELDDAFGADLAFGTGGMRGPCGPGPGRMNVHVVGKAARGLAEFLIAARGSDPTGREGASASRPAGPPVVVVGCDVRTDSRRFTEVTARVLAAAGVKAVVHPGLCSTPQLSFAVRRLGADAGVMITASHNPPADNGFKVYQSDGCQLVAPLDALVVKAVAKAVAPAESSLPAISDARARGWITDVPVGLGQEYVAAAVESSRVEPGELAPCDTNPAGVRVLYSPYHGVGGTSVVPALRLAGADVRLCAAQAEPHPGFPTLPGRTANPESPDTFLALLAEARDADDLLLSTDPDADRLGAMVRRRPAGRHGDEWLYLNGNRIAVLVADRVIRRYRLLHPVRGGLVVRTMVTTPMLDALAGAVGLSVVSGLPVGFKYVGRELRRLLDADRAEEFVLGGEESHGLLSGPHALDKDAANAAVLLAAAAAEQKSRGRTLWQRLLELQRRHGIHAEGLATLSLTPAEGGRARADAMLASLRKTPPANLAGRPVVRVRQYAAGTCTITETATGAVRAEPADPGTTSVFEFTPDGADAVVLRPSGTEPKMKLYGRIRRPAPAEPAAASPEEEERTDLATESALEAADREVEALLAACMADFRTRG